MNKDIKFIFKVCFYSFILFSIPFGLFLMLLFQDVVKGLILGIGAGILYSFVLSIFSIFKLRVIRIKRKELKDKGILISDTPANHKIGKEFVGGCLYFLNDSLWYISHKFNLHVHECIIPYSEIKSVCKGKFINSICVTLKDGRQETFIVFNRSEHLKFINGKITA